MKKWVLVAVTVVSFAILFLAASVLSVSADSASSFCKGVDPAVVRDQASLPDPQCGLGRFALDIQGDRTWFDSFVEAEEFRNGRDSTYWFVPGEGEAETSTPEEAAVEETVEVAAVPTAIVTDPATDHWTRLAQLDPTFRSQGLESWLRAAGFTWSSLTADARQIEEETRSDGAILASGIQVKVVGLSVTWPNCMTTDQPVTAGSDTRMYQPDQRNPSKLWTNVPSFSGTATLWVDCSNWGQLAPGAIVDTSTATATPAPESNLAEVLQKLSLLLERLQQLLQPSE